MRHFEKFLQHGPRAQECSSNDLARGGSVETAGPSFNNGRCTLTFNRPGRHCQWTATPTDIQGQGRAPTFIHVRPSTIASTKIEVFTSKLQTAGSNKGSVTREPASFYVIGRC